MRVKRRKIEHETELNLVPMLDMFLSLIPFLLMSAVLVGFGGLFVRTPIASSAEQANQIQAQELDLAIQIDQGKVRVFGFKDRFEQRVEEIKGEFEVADHQGLKDYLTKIQANHPKIRSSVFRASAETKYEDAVGVLNLIRTSNITQNVVLGVGSVQ